MQNTCGIFTIFTCFMLTTDRTNSSVVCAGPWVCCLEIEWMLKFCLSMFLCSIWSLKQSFDNHFNPGGIYYGAKCYAQTSGQLFITFKWWHFSKYHSSCIINNVSITIPKIHGASLSKVYLSESAWMFPIFHFNPNHNSIIIHYLRHSMTRGWGVFYRAINVTSGKFTMPRSIT